MADVQLISPPSSGTVSFGIACGTAEPSGDAFTAQSLAEYVFLVTPAGAPTGGDGLVVLRTRPTPPATRVGAAGDMGTIVQPGLSNEFRAECRAGESATTLTMFVNDQEVLRTGDPSDPITEFNPLSLTVSSDGAGARVLFDNVTMTEL